MRNFLLLLLFVLPGLLLAVETQFDYTFENNNDEGAIHRLDLTGRGNFASVWEWNNHLTLKSSAPQDTLVRDYLRNYVRDRVDLTRFGQKLYLNVHGETDYYTNENFYTHVGGWTGEFRNRLALNGGFSGELHLPQVICKLNADLAQTQYNSHPVYDQDSLLAVPNNPTDRNLTLSGEIEGQNRLGIRPYLSLDHFNDLDSSNEDNTTDYQGGVRYERKFNTIFYLFSEVNAGHADYFQDYRWYTGWSGRFTFKRSQNWMLAERIEGKLWQGEHGKSAAWGNNFAETMLQYTLNFDRANRVNRAQFAIRHYTDGWVALRGSVQAHWKRVLFFAEGHHYFGDDLIRTDMFDLQSGFDFGPTRVLVGVHQDRYRKQSDSTSFLAQLSYLRF